MYTTSDPARALLARERFDAADLLARHPPAIRHAGKRQVFEIASAGREPRGAVEVARYAAMAPPATVPSSAPELLAVAGFYRYPAAIDGRIDWHVNFADPDLFFAYGGAAFAQDEMQVAEHPVLASVREALLAKTNTALAAVTVEQGQPTPVLVRGAERWCAIDTEPDLAAPYGIYGRRFHQARPDVLRQAVTRLEPPTRTNLVAIAAPACGAGQYTRDDVELIVRTAFTGFAAACLESRASVGPQRVVIHTGHWGCGAFGGDRLIMAVLQLLSARLAGVDELVYYTVDAAGDDALAEARRIIERLAPAGAAVADVITAIVGLGLAWGSSDGN